MIGNIISIIVGLIITIVVLIYFLDEIKWSLFRWENIKKITGFLLLILFGLGMIAWGIHSVIKKHIAHKIVLGAIIDNIDKDFELLINKLEKKEKSVFNELINIEEDKLSNNKNYNISKILITILGSNDPKSLECHKKAAIILGKIRDTRAVVPLCVLLSKHWINKSTKKEIETAIRLIGDIRTSLEAICGKAIDSYKSRKQVVNKEMFKSGPTWRYDVEKKLLIPPKGVNIEKTIQIKSLSYIKESRKIVGTYGKEYLVWGNVSAGISAVIISWDVYVVDIDKVLVTAKNNFEGPPPPERIYGSPSENNFKFGIGTAPLDEYEKWIKALPHK